jgi:catechol 2,3-dioxygenase-like lactoylglutathione lyase family enzyme
MLPDGAAGRLSMRLDRIHQIAVYAQNLDEAISFYRDTLCASCLEKFDPPDMAFLDSSGVRLLLEKVGPKSTLYFWVDGIDSTYAELRSKGIEFNDQPHLIYRDDTGVFGKPGEEEWLAFFSDPSGNVLALATRRSGRG